MQNDVVADVNVVNGRNVHHYHHPHQVSQYLLSQ